MVGTLCTVTIVTKIKVGRLPPQGHSTNISRLFVLVTVVSLVILVPKKETPLIAGSISLLVAGEVGLVASHLLQHLIVEQEALPAHPL